MDKHLKNVIHWSIYIVGAIAILLFLISMIVQMLQPSLFPDKNIDGFKQYLTISSILVSFLSAGLGVLSIHLANQSGKQSEKIIDALNIIKEEQTEISRNILNIKRVNIEPTEFDSSNNWNKDNVVE